MTEDNIENKEFPFMPFLKAFLQYLEHFKQMVVVEDCKTGEQRVQQSFIVCIAVNELQDKILDLIKVKDPEGYVCPFCDPEKFVVYGKCKKCGKEERPPLLEGLNVPMGFCTEQGSAFLTNLMKKAKNESRLQDEGSRSS